jgi:hypothetical protein
MLRVNLLTFSLTRLFLVVTIFLKAQNVISFKNESQNLLKDHFIGFSSELFQNWWNKESEILMSHSKCFSLEKHIGVCRKEDTLNHATSYEILCETKNRN